MVELTYKLPFERLTRFQSAMLARSRRIALRRSRGRWSVFLISAVLLIGLLAAIDPVMEAIAGVLGSSNGALGYFALLALLLVLSSIGTRLMLRRERRQARDRFDYDQPITLKQHEEGIRISTDAIEYGLKWRGIDQMLLEPDGIVLAHGHMFWLIPDSAFPSPAARNTFIRGVYGRLRDEARSASAPELKPLVTNPAS